MARQIIHDDIAEFTFQRVHAVLFRHPIHQLIPAFPREGAAADQRRIVAGGAIAEYFRTAFAFRQYGFLFLTIRQGGSGFRLALRAGAVVVLGVVGIPVSSPRGEISRPAGRPVADQAKVAVAAPPVATSENAYSWPTVPGGTERLTMVSGASGDDVASVI